MPCYGPLTGYYPAEGSPDKRLVFDKRKSNSGVKIEVPCGCCTGCRLERSRQWAMRCMHEKRMHELSSFLTLTYDDKYLPDGNSLSMYDYQCFMKRLRKRFGNGIRFCGCGEYGEVTHRPHYHILLLNHDFSDRKFLKKAPSGASLYSSKELDGLWSRDGHCLGFSVVGNVDFDSCCYVARYVMKKVIGKDTFDSSLYDAETGVVKEAPFMTMSRRPGLGSSWYERYGAHAYEWDSVVFNGVECKPPRFYDTRRVGPLINDEIKKRRRAKIDRADQGSRRRRVKEVVAMARLQLKGRVL